MNDPIILGILLIFWFFFVTIFPRIHRHTLPYREGLRVQSCQILLHRNTSIYYPGLPYFPINKIPLQSPYSDKLLQLDIPIEANGIVPTNYWSIPTPKRPK